MYVPPSALPETDWLFNLGMGFLIFLFLGGLLTYKNK